MEGRGRPPARPIISENKHTTQLKKIYRMTLFNIQPPKIIISQGISQAKMNLF
jgi:hypothetical protein